MPHFSVIMPVYNHRTYVAEAIHSVLRQTVGDWELVVVDDGSTDGSGALIDDLARNDPRIVVHHQANAGASASRNTAGCLARGQWLTYLDSDDVWDRRALEHFVAAQARWPDGRFFHGYYHRLQDGRVVPLEGNRQDGPSGTADLFLRMFLNPMCICHLRDLWQQCGGFDESLRCCEDYDLYLRMSLRCAFEPINQLIGYRRRHGSNISRQTGRSQQTEAEVLRRFAAKQGNIPGLDGDAVKKRLARLHYRASRQFLKEKRYRKAEEEARKAVSAQSSFKAHAVRWLGWLLRPISAE